MFDRNVENEDDNVMPLLFYVFNYIWTPNLSEISFNTSAFASVLICANTNQPSLMEFAATSERYLSGTSESDAATRGLPFFIIPRFRTDSPPTCSIVFTNVSLT